MSKNWIELRELDESCESEIIYVKHQDIDRISIKQTTSNFYRITILTKNTWYLLTNEETLEAAESMVKGVISDIES